MDNYKRLGNYIREIDVRNTDLKVSLLLGVSVDKRFIESHANTVGTDFSSYKIVKKGQFAYGPVTSRNGNKISIALLREADECLISSSYISFEIINKELLDPEYLMLLFNNPEFDRYARYNSWGSAREVFPWDELCNSSFYIPCIEEQRRIVGDLLAIDNRIKILKSRDASLRELAIHFVSKTLLSCDKKECKLSDIADIFNGYSYSSDELVDSKIGMATIKNFELGGGYKIDGYKPIKPIKRYKNISLFDIVIACTDLTPEGAVVGNVEMVLDFGEYDEIIPSMDLVIVKPRDINPFLLVMLLKHFYTKELILSYAKGTTVIHLDKSLFEKESIFIPTYKTVIDDLSNKLESIFKSLSQSLKEQKHLDRMKKLLLSRN